MRTSATSSSFFVLGALLLLTPLALALKPSSEILGDGVWAGTYVQSSGFPLRAALVAIGLFAPVVVAAVTTMSFLHDSPAIAAQRLILNLSVFCATFAVGWRMFPYWVNGVFQANAGRAPLADFDPKALPPMTWIGEVWRLPVFLFYPTAALGVLTILPLVVAGWQSGRYPTPWLWLTLGAWAVTLGTLMYSPGYFGWLMD